MPALRRLLLSIACASGLAAAHPARADDAPLKPVVAPIAATGSFGFTSDDDDPDDILELRRAASGVACWEGSAGARRCLIAFDEGGSARLATLSDTAYEPDPAAVTVKAGAKEVDAEGAAVGDGKVFVVGSHAMKRKMKKGACKPNPDSATLVRYGFDAAAGRPTGQPQAGFLIDALRTTPALAPHLGKCLNKGQGLDIEGVAYQAGRLWFGFRGPAAGGQALLLSVDAEGVFDASKAPVAGDLHRAAVGAGRAIRDMQAVGDDLLLLVGPDDREGDQPYGLVLWNATAGARWSRDLDLAGLPGDRPALDGCTDKEIKPEAVSVVDPAADPWRILILSDGLCDGGPMWFETKTPG
ncbi:DUF3616 domain-containing protein [Hansschlegelia sp. KR7-227]|uniref:DUF3616 domain-containing protein n=1 Tax=Hansschlegelia sp. KR7-227 TaxID=3400914 RepID=UPI003C0D4CB7